MSSIIHARIVISAHRPRTGIGSGPDPRWNNDSAIPCGFVRGCGRSHGLWRHEGHRAAYLPPATRSLAPMPANPEFLVYAPSGGSFTVELPNTSGRFAVEWMNAATGVVAVGADVDGGATRTFTPPFGGDVVLYLESRACESGWSEAAMSQLPILASSGVDRDVKSTL